MCMAVSNILDLVKAAQPNVDIYNNLPQTVQIKIE